MRTRKPTDRSRPSNAARPARTLKELAEVIEAMSEPGPFVLQGVARTGKTSRPTSSKTPGGSHER